MRDVRKINLANMTKNELLELANQEYKEFEPRKDLPPMDTFIQRNNLKTIAKHLQIYSLEDNSVLNLRQNIEDVLLTNSERMILNTQKQRKEHDRQRAEQLVTKQKERERMINNPYYQHMHNFR